MQLGIALEAVSEPDDLVLTIANSIGDPVGIYYSRRRGWVYPPAWPGTDWGSLPEDDGISVQLFEELRAQGAEWFGIVDYQYDHLWADHPLLAAHIASASEVRMKTEEYVILRILRPDELALEDRK
jgi:hypothetical protein